MASRVTIRSARPEDARSIQQLLRIHLKQPCSLKRVQACVDSGSMRVATCNGTLCAFTFYVPLTDSVMVDSLIVKANRQGKGIGTRMMHDVIREAKDMGYEVIELSSSLENVSFYEKLGFVVKDKVHRHRHMILNL